MRRAVRFSLKLKTSLFIGVLVSFAIFVLSAAVLSKESAALRRGLRLRGEFDAKRFAKDTENAIASGDEISIYDAMAVMVGEEDIHNAYILDRGRRFLHARKTAAGSPWAEKGSPEDLVAATNGWFVARAPDGEEVYNFFHVVRVGGRPLGTAHIEYPTSLVRREIASARAWVFVIAALSVVAGVGLAFALAYVVLRPVNTLAAGAKRIGTGDFDHRIAIGGSDELGALADEFNEMAASLKQAEREKMEKDRMAYELNIAHQIQESLIPRAFPTRSGLDFASFYKSAKEVGGDYYDILPLSEAKIGMVMADVSGKGVPGAIVMTMFRSLMRAYATPDSTARETLVRVNEPLYHDMKPGMFVTVFYGILDLETMVFDFACAGHDHLVVYRAEGSRVELYKPEGFAMGVRAGRKFEEGLAQAAIRVRAGDVLIQYTDGILEAMNTKREEFGGRRFYAIVQRHGGEGARVFLDALNHEVDAFTRGAEQNDDIAVIAVRVSPGVAEVEGDGLEEIGEEAEKLVPETLA